jgi:hypothetical protein
MTENNLEVCDGGIFSKHHVFDQEHYDSGLEALMKHCKVCGCWFEFDLFDKPIRNETAEENEAERLG